jgi:hypothetical protein
MAYCAQIKLTPVTSSWSPKVTLYTIRLHIVLLHITNNLLHLLLEHSPKPWLVSYACLYKILHDSLQWWNVFSVFVLRLHQKVARYFSKIRLIYTVRIIIHQFKATLCKLLTMSFISATNFQSHNCFKCYRCN